MEKKGLGAPHVTPFNTGDSTMVETELLTVLSLMVGPVTDAPLSV